MYFLTKNSFQVGHLIISWKIGRRYHLIEFLLISYHKVAPRSLWLIISS